MSKQYLYIIDTAKPYNGSIENSMPFVPKNDINATKVHCSDLTFEQYNKQHGGTLSALDFETFYKDYYKPHINGLQEPFVETTEERFEDGLNCLPPRRWTRFPERNIEYFFVGECETDNIYRCYVKKGDKYYSALRSIETPTEHLFNLEDVK